MKKKRNLKKKLAVKKETVSNLGNSEVEGLSTKEMNELKAAKNFTACWENLWTIYFCRLVWTGDSKTRRY